MALNERRATEHGIFVEATGVPSYQHPDRLHCNVLGDITNTEINFNMAMVVSGVVKLDAHYK